MRSNLDNNRARGLLLDGALLLTQEKLGITATMQLVVGMPHIIAFDPGNTTRAVKMYTPTVLNLSHKHEIFNVSAGTGGLTIQDPTGATTLGTIMPGQQAEVFWLASAQAWSVYVQTAGNVNTAASKQTLQQYTTLAGIVNAQVMALAVPFNFILNSVGFRTRTPASTASKLATLTAQVNGVSVTGGVISLTTANQNTSGGLTAGTTITGGNVGTAGQTIGVVASAVTAFVEGDGYVEYNLTNTSLNL